MSARSARRAVPEIRPPQGAGIRGGEHPEVRRLQGALELPIDQIRPDGGQPRRDWQHDEGDARLADLAGSIREFGILQPLLVGTERVGPDGVPYYPLIAGNRRLIAARQAGLSAVPALVRDTPGPELRVLQLTENLQRQGLAPLDEGRAYRELMDLETLSPPELATRLHVSETLVRNRLHLLDDQVLADAVERGQIAASAARQILQLPDEERSRFRDRVIAGEHVRTNDLATARARLRAEGVPHPRRSPRPALPLGPPPPLPPPPVLQEPVEAHGPSGIPGSISEGEDEDEEKHRPGAGQAEGPGQAGGGPVGSQPDALEQMVAAADPGALELLRRLARHGGAGGMEPRFLQPAVLLLGDLLRHGIDADIGCGALFGLIWGPPDE